MFLSDDNDIKYYIIQTSLDEQRWWTWRRRWLLTFRKKMWLYVSRDGKMCGCENAEKPQSDSVSKHYIANFHVVVRYCWSRETYEFLLKDVDLLSRANVESFSLRKHQAQMNIGDGTWKLSSHAAHVDPISYLKQTFVLILPPLPLELILQSSKISTRDSI